MRNFCLSSGDISLESSDSKALQGVTSIRYNAAISALELRAVRDAYGDEPRLVQQIGKSPLAVFLLPGPFRSVRERACEIHFESATCAFPFEVEGTIGPRQRGEDGESWAVQEVVVLRGLRIVEV